MKRHIIHLIFLFIFVVMFFSGCDDNKAPESGEELYFLSQQDIGMIVHKKYVMRYDKQTCQIVINNNRKLYRIQTDAQSQYVNMLMSNYPGAVNEKITAETTYKYGNVNDAKTMQFTVLKVIANKYWLWNDEEKIGIIFSSEP